MTLKNVPITIGFVVITTSQFVFGLYSLVQIIRGGGKVKTLSWKGSFSLGVRLPCRDCACAAQQFPPIPLDPFHICLFAPIRTLHIAYTGVSLFYGVLKPSQAYPP